MTLAVFFDIEGAFGKATIAKPYTMGAFTALVSMISPVLEERSVNLH